MYKITMNDGKVLTANNVTNEGSFIVLNKDSSNATWIREWDIVKIESSDDSDIGKAVGGLILLALTGGVIGF